QGIRLGRPAERLRQRGGPHFGSPDKDPALRLETIRVAGEAAVPFTSGILIGIGETRRERIEAMLALRDLHDRHGHLQEIIIQNFRAKPGTRMARAPEPDLEDHLWTIAVARLIFGPEMNIQAPPNLNPGAVAEMIGAGIEPPTLTRLAALGTLSRNAGEGEPSPQGLVGEGQVAAVLERALAGETLGEAEIVRLFAARGADFDAVCRAADRLRQRVNG